MFAAKTYSCTYCKASWHIKTTSALCITLAVLRILCMWSPARQCWVYRSHNILYHSILPWANLSMCIAMWCVANKYTIFVSHRKMTSSYWRLKRVDHTQQPKNPLHYHLNLILHLLSGRWGPPKILFVLFKHTSSWTKRWNLTLTISFHSRIHHATNFKQLFPYSWLSWYLLLLYIKLSIQSLFMYDSHISVLITDLIIK